MSQVCCNWQCGMCWGWECNDTKEEYDKCAIVVPVRDFVTVEEEQ